MNGGIFDIPFQSWSWGDVLWKLIVILVITLITYSASVGFNRFIGRVRAGHGAWRSFILRSAPFALFFFFSTALLLVANVVFEASHTLFFVLLIVFFSVSGVATIGLLRNVFAGIVFGLQRRFHVGDHVRIGELEGDIVRFGLQSVRLEVVGGTQIEVPNRRFSSDVVEKTQGAGLSTPLSILVPIPSETDLTFAKEVAYRAACASKYATPRLKPTVYLSYMPDSNQLALDLHVHVAQARLANHLRSEIVELLNEALHPAEPQ